MLKNEKRFAIALRAQVHPPASIVALSKLLEENAASSVTNVFLPDNFVGADPLEVSAASLGATKRLKIGTGVIRPLEHDPRMLQRRLETIQAISGNRFVLGIGTGSPGRNPSERVESMLSMIESMKENFGDLTGNSTVEIPEIYAATLRVGIARRVAGRCTGILLNFCSPEYAGSLVDRVSKEGKQIDYACYLKVFFSRNNEVADRLLIEEFANYDSIKQYHEMFVMDGSAGAIEEAKKSLSSGRPAVPKSLQRISLANPSTSQLKEYVESFRDAGVTLPCIYPYFAKGEDQGYRTEIVKTISESL